MTGAGGSARWAAWAAGLVAAVVAGLVGLASWAEASAAAVRSSTPASQHVVVVGLPGLRWSDVAPDTTPTLWGMVATSSVGQMSTRSARSRTCPADGWLQLGTGNRARYPIPDDAEPGSCQQLPRVVPRDTGGAMVVGWPAVVAENEDLSYGAEVGLLADELAAQLGTEDGCTLAAGDGATLAAADGEGVVDSWLAVPSVVTQVDLAACPLSVVSLAPLSVDRPDDELATFDAVLARVERLRPAGSLLLVLGVSDLPDERPQLHVALAAGPGFAGGELVSGSTRRAPFVQLSDVAPTVLTQLGLTVPSAMPYQPMRSHPGSGLVGTEAQLQRLGDLARQADVQGALTPPFFLVLVLSQAALYVAVWLLLRRRPQHPTRTRLLGWTHVLAVAYAAGPAATYLANLVPWWDVGRPVPVLLLAVGAAVVTLTGIAFVGPWRRHPFGPAGAVAAATAVVLSVDVATGAQLQLSSLAGYSPIVAGRFVGFGNLAFAIFGTAALLGTAALVTGRSTRVTSWVVGGAAVLAVVVDGAPGLGSDFGGVIALVPAFATLLLLATGRTLSWRRLLVLVGVGVALVSVIAVADYLRPADERSHLGRFVDSVLQGTAGIVVQRKVEANLSLLTNSVLTLIVPLALVFLTFLLRRPSGLLLWTFVRVPTLRAGLVAVLVLGIVGGLVNDSGIAIPTMAATLAIPVAVAVIARSLQREDDLEWPSRHGAEDTTAVRVADPGPDDS